MGLIYRFPFDTNSPNEYLIAFIFQYMMVLVAAFISLGVITISIGTSLMLVSIIKDLKADLRSLNENAKKGNRLQIFKQLFKFIELHSNAKQLSERKLKNINQIEVV